MGFLGGGGDVVETILSLEGVSSYVSGQQTIASGWRNAAAAQDTFGASAQRASNLSNRLISGGAAVATSALVLGHSFLKAAGDMQATRSGFATMLGSMDAAKAKIGELQEFAAKTPFDFQQSAKGAQQLLAMGVSGDALVPTMRSVASAVAAASGNTDDFLGALRAIGQIKTKGVVSQEELNQLTERGIPALQILQKEMGLTKDQMANLGNQKIDADKAIGALLSGFDKRFGSALTDAAGNYNTAESGFSDALNQFKVVAGESLIPMATEALNSFTGVINQANAFLALHPDFARYALTFAALGGGLMVVGGWFKKIQANAMLAAAATKILATETAAVGSGGASGGAAGGRSNRSGGASLSSGSVVGSDAAEASDKIARSYQARIKASKDLSRAMRDLHKAPAGSDEARDAQARVNRARSVRAKLDAFDKKTRGDFAQTEEGKGAGGGDALGTAKDIAAAIASGEDASDALKSKLQEIGQQKLDDFLGDPKGTLAEWKQSLGQFKGQALSTFTSLKGFLKGGLTIPGAGASGMAGRVGALAGRVGLQPGAVNTANAFSGLGRFGSAGGQMTGGGAVMGAALGVGAAVGARDDLKALGASEGAADLYAGILGAVTTGVTAFFPPARLIVGAAELFRAGVDKFYTEPLEKAATEGSLGTEGEKKIADAKTKQDKANVYFDLAEKARNEGDATTASSFMLTANSLQRQDKRDAIQGEKDAAAKRGAEFQKAAREKDMLENPEKYTGVDPNASPYLRAATGLPGNGAFDNEEDPAPFSMNKRLLASQGRGEGGLDFAGNYGGEGLNANDYYQRSRAAAGVTGSDASGGNVTDTRSGETVVRLPRRQADDLTDRLRRHNQLRTQF